MGLLEKELYSLQDIADEINELDSSKNKRYTPRDILEQGRQGKIIISTNVIYGEGIIPSNYSLDLYKPTKHESQYYELSPEDCKTMLFNESLVFKNIEMGVSEVAIKNLYVLRKEKERFMEIMKQKILKYNLRKIGYEDMPAFLNEEHPHFAPDLKYCIEAWTAIFLDKIIVKNPEQQSVQSLVKKWAEKKQMNLTKSQTKMIATIITPSNKKVGGAPKAT